MPASELNPTDLRDLPEIQARIAKRVASNRVKVLQEPRPGKKLLVLDIDYTLFDLGSTAERPEQLARPFLHEFLSSGEKSVAVTGSDVFARCGSLHGIKFSCLCAYSLGFCHDKYAVDPLLPFTPDSYPLVRSIFCAAYEHYDVSGIASCPSSIGTKWRG